LQQNPQQQGPETDKEKILNLKNLKLYSIKTNNKDTPKKKKKQT
jgi:hypothetical protein